MSISGGMTEDSERVLLRCLLPRASVSFLTAFCVDRAGPRGTLRHLTLERLILIYVSVAHAPTSQQVLSPAHLRDPTTTTGSK